MRFGVGVCFPALMVTFAVAQAPAKPTLIVACVNPKASYTPTDIVQLTITIENRGTSRLYRSNYDAHDGFGLPILTRDDGEIVGNKIEFAVR
jgi:hypothetical protein